MRKRRTTGLRLNIMVTHGENSLPPRDFLIPYNEQLDTLVSVSQSQRTNYLHRASTTQAILLKSNITPGDATSTSSDSGAMTDTITHLKPCEKC